MQNKANLLDALMNVNKVLTKDYEKKTLGERGKKQSQTKPNKANLLNAQMNVNKVLTKDYENNSNWALGENKPNTNPIQTQSNPMLARHQCGGSKAKKCCRINGPRKSMLDARFWCRQAALEAATCPFTPVVRRIFAGFGHIFLFIFIAHG